MEKHLIVARLRNQTDEQPCGLVTLRGGELEISEVEDVGLMVRLNALFLSPRRSLHQLTSDASEILMLEPRTPLHFLSCLEQLERDNFDVVLEKAEL